MVREEKTTIAISPFFNWLIINIPVLVKITDESLSEKTGYSSKDVAAQHP